MRLLICESCGELTNLRAENCSASSLAVQTKDPHAGGVDKGGVQGGRWMRGLIRSAISTSPATR